MLQESRIKAFFPWVAAVASGMLIFIGYAGFDQFYLEWFCLVPVLWAVRDQRPARAFLIGWLAGIVGHAGGFYWVIQMFQQFAGVSRPIASLGLLFVAAANGIVVAVWAWATRLITRATGWSVVWVAPVVWTAVEMCWPELFPNYLGASQYKFPLLTQIADLTGILGVSFLLVYLNSTVYAVAACWWESRRFAWRPLCVLTVVIGLVLCYGELRIRALDVESSAAEKLSIGLIQANRGAADNHSSPQITLNEHQALTRTIAARQALDPIVWPETVCSIRLSSPESLFSSSFDGSPGTPLLFGACLQRGDGAAVRLSNSALLADASGRITGCYDKGVLVPFGEYVPFGDIFPVLYTWSGFASSFQPGEGVEPLTLGRHLLSVSVCYEDIFPARIRRLMSGGSAGRVPDMMFNLTNDSWYGKSTEPMEHLALASFRSIENRRSLVRVTNTGVSAFVDPVGRIVSHTGIWTKEVLVGRVPLLQGRTVYARLGDWFGWLCTALTLCTLAWVLKGPRRERVRSQATSADQSHPRGQVKRGKRGGVAH